MTANLSRNDCLNFFVELLEISIHQILWAKKLYPKGAFKQFQKFNVLVHKSIHPEVNTYISGILNTVRFLLDENFIERLVLVIKNDSKPIEKCVFLFHSYFKANQSGKATLNVGEIQNQARALWLTMGHRFSSAREPEEDVTFTFEIHTRSVGYDSILERQSTTDELQWIVADKETIPVNVVAVKKVESQPFCLEVYKEDFTQD